MKNITILLLFILPVFIGCKGESSKKTADSPENSLEKLKESAKKLSGKTEKEIRVCKLLTKAYLAEIFPGATGFKQQPRSKPYPSCSYRFKYNGKNHKAGVVLVSKYASEKNLDKAVSYFSKKETVTDMGKKAYYIPQLGQFSVFTGKYLLHVYVTVNEKGNKDLARRIVKDLLNEL